MHYCDNNLISFVLDIFPCRRLTNPGNAAGRKIIRNLYSVASPLSRVRGPEGLRQTQSERHRRAVHTTECEKVHGCEGLAVVATVGQNYTFAERAPYRIRAQTEVCKYTMVL